MTSDTVTLDGNPAVHRKTAAEMGSQLQHLTVSISRPQPLRIIIYLLCCADLFFFVTPYMLISEPRNTRICKLSLRLATFMSISTQQCSQVGQAEIKEKRKHEEDKR
jgi:hypothetical protein